jgi:uncharacterized membrane protein YvbJ
MLEKAKELAKSLGKQSGDYMEVAKLNVDISAKLKYVGQVQGELGKYICGKYANGERNFDDYTLLLCERVERTNAYIKTQRYKISQIKSAYGGRFCVSCGASVRNDALYCYLCGAKLEDETEL